MVDRINKSGSPKKTSSVSRPRRAAKSRNAPPGESYNIGNIGDLSGDFRGAKVNFSIKSTLTNVRQNVGDIQTDDQDARKELETLIGQLSEALQKVPEKSQEHAQAVAETAKVLVDTAKAEKPNKTMLQITGEGLKQAAQNLAGVMPVVATIASQIVMTVAKLTSVR